MRQGRIFGSDCVAAIFSFECKVVNLFPNITYLPSHRQAGTSMTNLQ